MEFEEESESPFERLFELFDWSNRDAVYRVRFTDGDEYELTGLTASQDEHEPPHGSAMVVSVIRRDDKKPWSPEDAMFFHLLDIATVADARTREILYPAVNGFSATS